jgi:hypothetical protein
MTEEQIALARRAVACKGWRWMGGMLRCSPVLEKAYFKWEPDVMPTERVRDEDPFTDADQRWSNASDAWVQMIPVLTDPATLGCLLALVREAHAVQFLQVSVKISREHGYQFDCHPHHRGQWVDSEAEALVVALEAAP